MAERLAIDIRNAGHQVWLDLWKINVGDDIVLKINEGLRGATYVIVCYSSHGMAPWMDIEWASSLAAQLNGKNVRILPARLSGSNTPAILEGIKYADLLDDWNKGVADLMKALT